MQKYKQYAAKIQQKQKLNWVVGAAVALLLPFLYLAGVEFLLLRSGAATLQYVWQHLGTMLLGSAVASAVTLLLLLLTARPWVANLVCGGVLFAFGFANYNKMLTRGDPVLPKDLRQTGEALGMAVKMKTDFTREAWLFIAAILLFTLLLLPFRLPFKKGWKSLTARLVSAGLCLGFIPLFVIFYIGNKPLMERRHGINSHDESIVQTYERGSFLTSFLHMAATQRIQPPANYSQENMQKLAGQLSAQNGRQADVVVVMLESFYNLGAVQGLHFSQPLLPNYTHLSTEGVSGQLLSDKRGGGTSDYEFSMLTGFSTSFLPLGSVPYLEYVKDDFPGAPSYYRSQGYQTIAIHPYDAKFYNRDDVYAYMGFEQFLTLDTFSEDEVEGMYVSDAALARHIIQEYDARTAQGGNVFIHAISMQNHNPYEGGKYSPKHTLQVSGSGYGQEYDDMLSALATGIRDGDAMIGVLADYFSRVERDVVLVVYGDHQSWVNHDVYPDIAENTPAYQQADETQQFLMTHTTPYLIWTNYNRQAADGGLITSNMLLPTAMAQYGLDGPAWFGWLAQQSGTVSGTVGGWHVSPNGAISQAASPAQQSVLDEMRMFEYDIMFGGRYAQEEMYA